MCDSWGGLIKNTLLARAVLWTKSTVVIAIIFVVISFTVIALVTVIASIIVILLIALRRIHTEFPELGDSGILGLLHTIDVTYGGNRVASELVIPSCLSIICVWICLLCWVGEWCPEKVGRENGGGGGGAGMQSTVGNWS